MPLTCADVVILTADERDCPFSLIPAVPTQRAVRTATWSAPGSCWLPPMASRTLRSLRELDLPGHGASAPGGVGSPLRPAS